jgi:hypothetical protein
MVGSGKTTAVREITSFAKAHGIETHAHRFQSLPCITLRPRRRRDDRSSRGTPSSRMEATSAGRWSGYKRKRLGIAAVTVFVARILAFRLYRRAMWKATEWNVLNRYFYDSLSHYQPRSSRERLYYRTIVRLIPRPDLAIIVTAGLGTIAARRPAYSKEYIELVGESYRRLASEIPDLIDVSTDTEMTGRLTAILLARLR